MPIKVAAQIRTRSEGGNPEQEYKAPENFSHIT